MGLPRTLRKSRVLLAMLLFTAVLIWVPIVPYSPSCWERPSVGAVLLSPAFQTEFTKRLRTWQVSYIAVDGLVLIRFWDWFADPDNWLINASNKAVLSLIDPAWGADVSTMPPRIRVMVEMRRDRDGFIDLDCPLVRAVAIEGW